ncbi:MAG: hypothetical protein AMJ56_06575 [Anaerolineae bacterium SG8_19]|jgi:hypothetical protein|nr:MAG: hypothetical protein AMJ56_06575 [Anaerolineae bacterium SG8_19]HCB50344.1 hypothetical protein [Chloroflexota bacterium]
MDIDSSKIIRNFLIELVVYGALVVAYFILVLRSLGGWLTSLYDNNLPVYSIVALVLIVVQAVFLEKVTSFLIERLGLERLE